MPANSAAPPPKTAPNTVEIGDIGGAAARVWLHVGDTLTVVLPSNVTTGYSWQVAANNDALLARGEQSNLPAESKKPGAPGWQKLLFTAKATGHARLALAYTRPWEKNAAPVRTLTLEVTIGNPVVAAPAPGVDGVIGQAVRLSGTVVGFYMGKLPCADCSGIDQGITLYSSGPDPHAGGYYVETMTYRGAPHGDTSNVSAGKWSQIRGTPSDPNATVYALSVESSSRTQNYELKNGSLVPLDDTLRPIQSPYDMMLHPVRKRPR